MAKGHKGKRVDKNGINYEKYQSVCEFRSSSLLVCMAI